MKRRDVVEWWDWMFREWGDVAHERGYRRVDQSMPGAYLVNSRTHEARANREQVAAFLETLAAKLRGPA